MIFSKIENPKKSSTKAARASGVVSYITAPENEKALEKCIYHEAVNFISDDLKSQTAEMISLAQEAVKSKDPIEHFVISWKSNERPTPEQASEAAAILIKQCGLTGHQYIIGLHDDTDNMHVHVAVNRVHPDTCKVVKINKGFDKEAGHQAIAIIEKVQGWSCEVNARYRTNDKAELVIDPETKRPQIFETAEELQQPTAKARAMEIQTGEKSAQRVGIERAAPIIAQATSWKDMHVQMAAAGMQYQRKGSGAVVQVGDELVKASDVSRTASLSALQKRFGPYQPPMEIKSNEYHHHTPQPHPHPTTLREATGNGMRNLSECNLAVLTNQGQTRRARVLHIDARPGGRPADRLRRTAGRDNSTGLTTQPMRQWQPGWHEYIAIRDAQKAAKTHETIALQKRHGDERAELAAKQKAERAELFSGNWKGKGLAKNALQSITATQQAADKLELFEQQRGERKALQAQYKPLPMYKQWKEQPLIVSLHVLPVIDQHITRDKQITVAQTLRSLTNRVDDRQHITYQLNKKDVFRDEGRTIKVLDLRSDAGIAAALAVAQQKFGNVLTLTGSPEFQQNAVAVAVANNLTCKFADPALDDLRARLQADKYQVERATTRAATERLQAEEKAALRAKAPEVAQSNQTREADEPAPAPEGQQPVPVIDQEAAALAEAAEAQKIADAEKAAEEHRLSEPVQLADIHKQIDTAKAAADPRSMFAHSTTIEADYDTPDHGVIVGSNEQFVAVHRGEAVKLYRTLELTKQLEYDGIDTGHGRFAPSNELTRKNSKDGMRTVLTEEREHMQTKARRERERERDIGHGL